VIRQLLVESVLLALVGGVAGVLLAVIGVHALLAAFIDPESVSLVRATPNMRVLAFTTVVALATGLLFGVAPALQSTRPALAPTLKDQAGSVTGGSVRVRKALVVSQVAVSLLLLIGAGLFLRSLNGLMTADLGFRSERLVTFLANPTMVGYKAVRAKQYASDLLAQIRATAGVSAAAIARIGLLQGGAWYSDITVEGYRAKENEDVNSRLNGVSPGYFAAMGIPLLMGRDFDDRDHRVFAEGEKVDQSDEGYRAAIVSESFARRYLSGNPLGRHIGFGADPGTPTRIEIVGVVRDSIYTGPAEERDWQIYVPFFGSADAAAPWVYVRTTDDPETMFQTVRRLMQQIDPSVPPLGLRTMEAQVKRSLANQRFVTGLSTVFGVLATLLAMVGLYGVLAYSVTRRTREIGVRMALGALAPGVVWLILRDAFRLIALGVLLALPAAWWLGRYIGSELHGVTPTDPATFATAALALGVAAAAAGLIPAARAARINPIRALRQE
jgi:predicted permease